jgi:hypothetical protein
MVSRDSAVQAYPICRIVMDLPCKGGRLDIPPITCNQCCKPLAIQRYSSAPVIANFVKECFCDRRICWISCSCFRHFLFYIQIKDSRLDVSCHFSLNHSSECTYSSHFDSNSNCPVCNQVLGENDFTEVIIADISTSASTRTMNYYELSKLLHQT